MSREKISRKVSSSAKNTSPRARDGNRVCALSAQHGPYRSLSFWVRSHLLIFLHLQSIPLCFILSIFLRTQCPRGFSHLSSFLVPLDLPFSLPRPSAVSPVWLPADSLKAPAPFRPEVCVCVCDVGWTLAQFATTCSILMSKVRQKEKDSRNFLGDRLFIFKTRLISASRIAGWPEIKHQGTAQVPNNTTLFLFFPATLILIHTLWV